MTKCYFAENLKIKKVNYINKGFLPNMSITMKVFLNPFDQEKRRNHF